MTTLTPEQLAKLPKWARDELTRLEREVNRLNTRLDERDALSHPATDESPAMYMGRDGKWYEVPSVKLRLKDRRGWIEMYSERPGGLGAGGVLIRASHSLQMDMQVANVVIVRDRLSYDDPEATA